MFLRKEHCSFMSACGRDGELEKFHAANGDVSVFLEIETVLGGRIWPEHAPPILVFNSLFPVLGGGIDSIKLLRFVTRPTL
jgi:hypothetical protein